MNDGLELARLYVQAQSQVSDEALATVKDALADDVTLKLPRSTLNGRESVIQQLANADGARGFQQADWEQPVALDGNVTRITGTLPLLNVLGGYTITLTLDESGRISHIEQQNLPAPPLPPSELRLSEAMQEVVNTSYMSGAVMLFAAVAPDGQPILSLRGSAQAFSDTQLAFWARNAEGGTVGSLDTNPKITAFLRDARSRTNLFFYGNGRPVRNEDERMTVYNNSPEVERAADPEIKGTGVIMDLERIEGTLAGNRVRLQRGAGSAK
jgi:hypothetical protein